MFEIITPAAQTRLISFPDARDLIGWPDSEDRAAYWFIDQVSQVIVDYCRRPFAIETVRDTFEDFAPCRDGMLLSRSPVVEIVSVITSATLLPAQYRLDRQRNRLHLVDTAGQVAPWWGGSLAVEYRAGYVLPDDNAAGDTTLPASVQRAAIILLSQYLAGRKRDPGVKQESTEGVGSTSWYVAGPGDVLASPEAQQLLAPFIRYYP